MKQVLRFLLTSAAATSLAVSAVAAVLWVRSFWRCDYLYYGNPSGPYVLWSEGGRLTAHAGGRVYDSGMTGWRASSRAGAWWGRPWEQYVPGVATRATVWGDFGYVAGWYPLPAGAPDAPPDAANPAAREPGWARKPPSVSAGRGTFRMFIAPGWAVAIVAGLLPAWWFPRLWREQRSRRRAARGLCPGCAYDLTGNASGVCPECGMKCGMKAVQRPTA